MAERLTTAEIDEIERIVAYLPKVNPADCYELNRETLEITSGKPGGMAAVILALPRLLSAAKRCDQLEKTIKRRDTQLNHAVSMLVKKDEELAARG